MAASFCIIGAGQTGGHAVATLREIGFSGAIHLVGAEPHPPYHRPDLSRDVLLGDDADPTLFDERFYADAGVTLRLGRPAARVDPTRRRVTLADGEAIPYDKLLIATGASPKRLDVPGCSLDGVVGLRTLEDALALRRRLTPGARVVIVGGGFIGLQVTATALDLGCEVTILEATEHLLARLAPPEIAGIVRVYHATRGVRIITEAPVCGFEGDSDGRLTRVLTADGRRVSADVAVRCCGVTPNTALAEAAGLVVDDGIIVDAQGRTSDPDIYAAGDCTRYFCTALGRRVRLESWQNARDQAAVAARAMSGDESRTYDAIPSLLSRQGEMILELIGVPERWEQVMLRGRPWIPDCTAFYLQSGRIVAGVVFNRPGDAGPLRQLVRMGAVVDPRALLDDRLGLREILAEHLEA